MEKLEKGQEVKEEKLGTIEKIKIPVLLQVGENDALKGFSDPIYSQEIAKKGKDAGIDFELMIWKNANHAFMNQDSENYNKEVAQKALDLMIEKIKKYLI